jgi:hypothetical protein
LRNEDELGGEKIMETFVISPELLMQWRKDALAEWEKQSPATWANYGKADNYALGYIRAKTEQFTEIAALKTQIEALRKDAMSIDWMSCQDLSDLVMGVAFDAPRDDKYFVHGDSDIFYGKTLRDALYAAISKDPITKLLKN